VNSPLLQLAREHHQAGRLAEARVIYAQILLEDPQNDQALHLLGLVHFQLRQFAPAAEYFRRSIQVNPNLPESHYNLGHALLAAKDADGAIAAFEKVIALRPDDGRAFNALGTALLSRDRLPEAVAAFQESLRINPQIAGVWNNLGVALHNASRAGESAVAFERAISLQPDSASAHNNLGRARCSLGDFQGAESACRAAIELDPNLGEAHDMLGHVLTLQDRLPEAVASLYRAVELSPDSAIPHLHLGMAHHLIGDLSKSEAHYRRAIELDRGLFAAWIGLAAMFFSHGKPEIGWNLILDAAEMQDPLASTYPGKSWDGSDPAGKTILVYADGNFGDTLLQARFSPLLQRRGAKVILQCQPQLVSLLGTLGISQAISRDDLRPAFDYYVPHGILSRRLGLPWKDIPGAVPYLRVPPDRLERPVAQVPGDGMLNIGLAWAASDTSVRSGRLEIFAPLAQIPGVRFFSLQKGPAAAQTPPAGMNFVDRSAELTDFADTAALVNNLDLVISVDSAVVHVAGALARPVWTLIPRVSGIFWAMPGDRTPWYPTMRLFRQTIPGDWVDPVLQMADALRGLVAASGNRKS
jgi:tetratricopeptide (TPR) repeat protein